MKTYKNTFAKFFNGKKILITGATGIIGIQIYKFLKKYKTTIHIHYLNEMDEEILKVFKEVTFKRFDITNLNKLNRLEDDYDIIFHCAGYGQPQKFTKDPEKTFTLNTFSLMTLAKKVKTGGHFLFISTSEIYSNNENTNENEFIKINLNNSRNCYILGKICGEQSLEWIAKKRNFNFKNIRVCLAFGPYFKRCDTRVLSELIFKALINKEIKLIDDGSALRKYIYVEDAVKMIFNILINGKQNIYNIGGKEEISILNLAKIISSITKSKIIIGKNENKLLNSPSFAGVCIDRYENEFGKISLTSIEEGIKKSIKWAKKILKKSNYE